MTKRREAFDEVAALYHEARPPYPDRLVQDLVELCGINAGVRALEIGPGTGQLTLPMAERGARITAVESGPQLAELARHHVAAFPLAEIITADFDRWVADAQFDVVVAATAFHWLDPSTRVPRCAAALRSGGKLAVIHTRWGVRTDPDPFREASRICFEIGDPEIAAKTNIAAVSSRLEDEEFPELRTSKWFTVSGHRRHVVARTYSTSQYVGLLNTFSDVRGLPESARAEFVTCIRQLIDREFGGSIERTDVYDLWVYERRPNDVDTGTENDQ